MPETERDLVVRVAISIVQPTRLRPKINMVRKGTTKAVTVKYLKRKAWPKAISRRVWTKMKATYGRHQEM